MMSRLSIQPQKERKMKVSAWQGRIYKMGLTKRGWLNPTHPKKRFWCRGNGKRGHSAIFLIHFGIKHLNIYISSRLHHTNASTSGYLAAGRLQTESLLVEDLPDEAQKGCRACGLRAQELLTMQASGHIKVRLGMSLHGITLAPCYPVTIHICPPMSTSPSRRASSMRPA